MFTLLALIGFAFVVYMVYNAYLAIKTDDSLDHTVLHLGGIKMGYGTDPNADMKFVYIISGGKKRILYMDGETKTIPYGS